MTISIIPNGFQPAARRMRSRAAEHTNAYVGSEASMQQSMPRTGCGAASLKGEGYTRGFTLIELLFVIAVLGLLSTSGILFYQQRMQEQKIQKTVAQMMQWQQAGMAYYVRNKRWPKDADTLIKEGYMPQDAASSSPWCAKKEGVVCYSVGSSQPQLFNVIAYSLPPASNDDGGVPGTIAARLTSAKPVKAGETSVTGIINIPLEGIVMNPDLIVVDLFPFVMKGASANFSLVGSGNTAMLEARNFLPNKKAFPCNTTYGKSYSFMPYVIISNYTASPSGNNSQPPDFSLIAMRAETQSDGRILLMAAFRPQIYLHEKAWGGLQRWISSAVPSSLTQALDITGQISFVCCKKGISCTDQPRA